MIKTIIIVGCGSIGQRHAQNAKQIGIENIILCDINLERIKKFSQKIGTNMCYKSYEHAFQEHPEIEAAIISTPSSLHIEPATFFAKKGVHLFVEKPLSDDLEGVDDLMRIVNENGVVTMMGQSYRFHEGFLYLKKLLDKEYIGKVYHANYFGGQYLPDWHPNMDYRKEYAAQKRLGGGVLLTNFSHSFDTTSWLFGNIIQMEGWKTSLSDLEMDVEDSVFCLIKTENGVVITVQSDFLQRRNSHQMRVIGEKGHIDADFIKNEIKVWIVEGQDENVDYVFNPNQRYIDELLHFSCLIERKILEHDLDLSAGIKVLKLIKSPKIIYI